jgi:hypothetical protein
MKHPGHTYGGFVPAISERGMTDAKLLLWYVNCKMDGKIRHLVDGMQWKHSDLAHQEDFSNDPRNIRFGLSTDGMNPFREMRNPHNMWPIIMCIFNLPIWLCHK